MSTLALHNGRNQGRDRNGGRLGDALGRLICREDGAILVETAIVLPILITMLLGSVEVGRYMLVNQKVERAATSIADLVAQSADGVTMDEIELLFGIIPHVTSPYDIGANGSVIITAVYREDVDDPAEVVWQVDGIGTLDVDSEIGIVGGAATLPPGFVLPEGETLIIGEAWYDYDALFFESVDPTGPIYHRAFYRPRLSTLNETPE